MSGSESPRLFVVMPFGTRPVQPRNDRGSIDFDAVYSELIKPVAMAAGWHAMRIDELEQPGQISDQYLEALATADLVLADISLPNPNVFYELGIRQATSAGGAVLVAVEGTQIPFDLSTQRVFFYSLEPDAAPAFKQTLLGVLTGTPSSSFANPIRTSLARYASAPRETVSEDSEAEWIGRIGRARTVDQSIAVWHWLRGLPSVPPLVLVDLAKQLGDNFGDWQDSVEVLRKAALLRPRDPEIQRELGWHLSKLGPNYSDEAHACYRRALEISPNDPETLGRQGGLYKRQGSLSAALDAYSLALTNSPSSRYNQVNVANLHVLLSPASPEQGIALYTVLLHDLQDEPDAARTEWDEVLLGESLFAIGDLERAQEHYALAVSLASSPRSLRSAADQLDVFAKSGFRTQSAARLASFLRDHIGEASASVTAAPTHRGVVGNLETLPVLIHLSDVHFGYRQNQDGSRHDMHRFSEAEYSQRLSRHLIEEVNEYFRFATERLYLIISGDLTYQGSADEFPRVAEFLEEVCGSLNVPRERVVLVPGNHDVNWGEAKIDLKRRFDNYLVFVRSFYGEELFRKLYPQINWDFQIDKPRPEPSDLVSLHVSPAAIIAGINSCVYENDQHHYGFVGGRQLTTLKRLLAEHSSNRDRVRVAVLHHHLHPFSDPVKFQTPGELWMDLSTIRDAGVVELELETLGFDVVLHGHKHKPQIRETILRNRGSHERETLSRRLLVCGAGSAGVDASELEKDIPNHYEVLEFHQIPRIPGADFLSVTWREIDSAPNANWITPGSWSIKG